MSSNRLIYLPLGGAGEIGMNAYVYGYGPVDRERLILVDVGVTFPDMETSPGVDLILPDLEWLAARADRLEAIFITHAHEDHIGALAHLWQHLKAPVHARAFTAHIGRLKLTEHGIAPETIQTASPWPSQIEAGPFKVGFMPVSHSVPESSALVIDTPAGRILHTGDFKLDETPIVGEPFSPDLWREVAKPGLRALVCDSTNVFSRHPGRSESTVGAEIEQLFRSAPGMIAATTFASNIARLKNAGRGGAAGRAVCCAFGSRDAAHGDGGCGSRCSGGFPKRDFPRRRTECAARKPAFADDGQSGRTPCGDRAIEPGQISGTVDERGRHVFVFFKNDPRKRTVGAANSQ